jgi:hypothetical protein
MALPSPAPEEIRLAVIDGGPPAIPWTHAGQVNSALQKFIA